MKAAGGSFSLSASDLSRFLGCRHLTALDMEVALGLRERPTWVDPILEVLRERGLDHEKGYVASLRTRGQTELDLSDLNGDEAVTATAEALSRCESNGVSLDLMISVKRLDSDFFTEESGR